MGIMTPDEFRQYVLIDVLGGKTNSTKLAQITGKYQELYNDHQRLERDLQKLHLPPNQ